MPSVSERPRDLPDFSRPPLVEVVLGVQFDPVPGFGVPTQANVWKSLNESTERFPTWEERPALDPVFELFGVSVAAPRLSVHIGTVAPPNRALFINAGKTELIQLQSDRFIRNWRQVPTAAQYPRYESLRRRFFDDFEHVSRALGVELRPNQCEVTYVNDIGLGNRAMCLSDILAGLAEPEIESLGSPERSQVALIYVIRDNDKPLGRLRVAAEGGAGNGKARITLTARGEPCGAGLDGVRRFFDIGREWVVKGFAALTSAQMHAEWGRTQ